MALIEVGPAPEAPVKRKVGRPRTRPERVPRPQLTSTEQKFQAKIIDAISAEGCSYQKFQDSLSAGVPDLLVGIPGKGIWLEVKLVLPRSMGSPLGSVEPMARFLKEEVSGPQILWLNTHFGRPLPTAVIVGSPETRWMVIPTPRLEEVLHNVSSKDTWGAYSTSAPLTFQNILRSYARVRVAEFPAKRTIFS